MIPKTLKTTLLLILLLIAAANTIACSTMNNPFAQSPPPSPNDPWADLAGGFPQH